MNLAEGFNFDHQFGNPAMKRAAGEKIASVDFYSTKQGQGCQEIKYKQDQKEKFTFAHYF